MENKGLVVAAPGEIAVAAAAATAKALIESAYIVAMKYPRNVDDARQRLLASCRRPSFAETAQYSKPVGGRSIVGPSIRFAEEAIQAMRNIRVESMLVYEDDQQRKLNISVTDLESNLTYTKEVILQKTVERSNRKGREVVAERTNTSGEKVFIVLATEDEMSNKAAAAESKVIRNSGLRLVPKDFIEEGLELCRETMRNHTQDPAVAKKKMTDAFAAFGIRPSELEKYLGHRLDQTTEAEIEILRGIHAAIKDGEAKWSDYVDKPRTAEAEIDPEKDLEAGDPGDLTGHDGEPSENEQKFIAESAKKLTLIENFFEDAKTMDEVDQIAKDLKTYESNMTGPDYSAALQAYDEAAKRFKKGKK